MAKSNRTVRLGETVDFSIEAPAAGDVLSVGSGLTITVRMDDSGSTDSFAVRIYSFSSMGGIGASPITGPTDFPGHNTTNKRSLTVGVGAIDTSITGNNRVVQVENKIEGRVIGHPFRVVSAGSNSVGGQPFQIRFCKPGQLLPVAVTLKLGSKVTKGTCTKCSELNKPTLLQHVPDEKNAGCWYSQPIAICGPDGPECYWVLERSSTTKWSLILKQADKVLVAYTAKTEPKDCTLPIHLERKGEGKKACKDWPKTVTIKPAK